MSEASWERRRGESKDSYARFLMYRNLGPSRSVEAAYKAAAKSSKSQHVSGQWLADSSRWKWPDRAHDWDIDSLVQHGEETVLAFMEVMRVLARKVLARIEKLDPADWSESLEAIKILSSFIPHEAIKQVNRSRGASQPGKPRIAG